MTTSEARYRASTIKLHMQLWIENKFWRTVLAFWAKISISGKVKRFEGSRRTKSRHFRLYELRPPCYPLFLFTKFRFLFNLFCVLRYEVRGYMTKVLDGFTNILSCIQYIPNNFLYSFLIFFIKLCCIQCCTFINFFFSSFKLRMLDR